MNATGDFTPTGTRLHDRPVEYDFPHESRILDVPNIRNDYYLSVMDWERTNILAVALDKKLYLLNADSSKISLVSEANSEDDYPASVAWSEDAKTIAAGYRSSVIELYDAETFKRVRCLKGHGRKDRLYRMEQSRVDVGKL